MYLFIDLLISTVVNVPIKYFKIFTIEEKYGFNK